MAEAIVSVALEQLTSITAQQINQKVSLVKGVRKEVKKLAKNLQLIQAVLADVEGKQFKDEAVSVWLDQLKDTSYDMEDVLDEWNTALLKLQIEGVENKHVPKKKVPFFFPSVCSCFKQVGLRHDIALKIKEINENLNDIVKMKDTFNFKVIESVEKQERIQSTFLVDESEIYGRVEDKNTLVSKLLSENSSKKDLHIISIVGMGGIGKTTLAQVAYNDGKVIKNFDQRIWVSVLDPFDECRIAKAIIENLEGSASGLVDFNSLMQKIHESIRGKKFLLVLDDVWTEEYNKWEPFYHCLKNGVHGSKILVTTRKERVALMMKSINILSVKELSEEECLKLFNQFAFFDRPSEESEELEEIGQKIVGKCKGLPLAAKTIGSLLRFKKTKEEWQHILDSEMWTVEEFEKGILPSLLLSYDDLSPMVKQCFSYCSIFPKDYRVRKNTLIKSWMAQGYLRCGNSKEMEIIGQEYFDQLAARSFFQEFDKASSNEVRFCKMHDIVHSFAQFLSKNECSAVEVNGVKDPFRNSSYEKVRHLMLTLNVGAPFPYESIYRFKRLRTLIIDRDFYGSLVLKRLCDELRCLRALTLHEHVKEIPKEIGNLIHLRYLNISWLHIKELPEKLCELYNLQTLDISFCKILHLPQGMGKLVNLRHLINEGTDQLLYAPIERLTCLRTLNNFNVSVGSDDYKGCSLEILKDLNHVGGKLQIRWLGRGLKNVTNLSEGKGKEILKNKKNLTSLWLDFYVPEGEERLSEDDELVLEALHPPPNLETLMIMRYRGNAFPSNLMTSLTSLKYLYITYCPNCKHLGKLPSLEKLDIFGNEECVKADNEFWGIESDATPSSSSAVLFSKLDNLIIRSMKAWEEWDYGSTRKGKEEDITFMPRIASLSISDCPKLKALPDSLLQRTTLKKFEIYRCPLLEERYKEGTGEDWHKPGLEGTSKL